MDPQFIEIKTVLPTGQWVIIEITGPAPQDICTKVVETVKLPRQLLEAE